MSRGPRAKSGLRLAAAAVLAVAGLASLCAPGPAHADPAHDQSVILFNQGLDQLAQNKLAEAIATFEKAKALNPTGLKLLLTLADAYAKAGRSADAWSQYHEAEAIAEAAHDARVKDARAGAQSIEGTLARLTIVVPDESDVPGLGITQNGVAVDRAEWAVARPVNPGVVVILATAAGKTWSQTKDVQRGAQIVVVVPALAGTGTTPEDSPAPTATTTGSATGTAPATGIPTAPPPPSQSGLPPLRVASLVTGGVGVAGLLTAAILGGVAIAQRDASAHRCVASSTGVTCYDPQAFDLRRQAAALADAATGMWVIGGAATAAGLVLWAVGGPKSPKTGTGPTPWIAAGPTGTFAGLGGRF